MSLVRELPALNIRLNNKLIDADLTASVDSVQIWQALNQPACCELVLQTSLTKILEDPKIGGRIEIRIADDKSVFEGEITAFRRSYVQGGVEKLMLRCYDDSHRLRKSQQLRQFDNMSLSSIVSSVLADYELSAQFDGDDCDMAQLMQWGQTDWAFLVESINRFGLHCFLDKGVLRVFSMNDNSQRCINIDSQQWLQMDIEYNSEPACRSVDVLAWNPQRAESIMGSAHADSAVGGVDDKTNPQLVNVSGKRLITGEISQDENEADSIGIGLLRNRCAGETILHAFIKGDAAIKPGCRISIEGVASDQEKQHEFVLTHVVHRFDRQKGYVCEIDSQPSEPITPRRINSSLAIVRDVDDPEDMGRVKVCYPELGMLESLWLEVLQIGAGPNKGFVALPDVDDRVLVIFVNGDPCSGIVLGGVFGSSLPPDFGIENGRVKRYMLVTPDGQKVILDDADKKVKIENSDGSYLEMSPNHLKLFSKQDMNIEAPGRAMVIGANTIDFKQL